LLNVPEGRPLPEYKFTAGDKVALMTNSSNANVRKSALDSHERVVDEAQLRRA
jgi:hypothetical protein